MRTHQVTAVELINPLFITPLYALGKSLDWIMKDTNNCTEFSGMKFYDWRPVSLRLVKKDVGKSKVYNAIHFLTELDKRNKPVAYLLY